MGQPGKQEMKFNGPLIPATAGGIFVSGVKLGQDKTFCKPTYGGFWHPEAPKESLKRLARATLGS